MPEPGGHGERLDPPAAFTPGLAKPVRACLEGDCHDRRELFPQNSRRAPLSPAARQRPPSKGGATTAGRPWRRAIKHIEVALECPVDLGRRQRSKAWFHGDGSGPTIRPRAERCKPEFVRDRTVLTRGEAASRRAIAPLPPQNPKTPNPQTPKTPKPLYLLQFEDLNFKNLNCECVIH